MEQMYCLLAIIAIARSYTLDDIRADVAALLARESCLLRAQGGPVCVVVCGFRCPNPGA